MSFNPSTGDATASSKGVIQLAGDFGGTASTPTVPSLAAKAPLANPTFTGTVTVPDGSFTVSKVTGLQTTLDDKQVANQYIGYVYVRPSGDTTSIPPSPVAGMIILNRLS